jgi:hypothetical protein
LKSLVVICVALVGASCAVVTHEDTQLRESDFDIPSCDFESFSKSWLNQWMPADTYRTGAKLAFKTELLRSCDSSSAP